MLGGVEQRHSRPGKRSSSRAGHAPIGVALRWGAAGFLLGAGFWIYLGARELTGGGLPQPQSAPEPGCTSLALDRHNGRTTQAPCLGPTQSLRDTLTAWLGESWLP
jgi:hypothetical protein